MTHSTAPAHPKKAAYTRAALCLLLSVLTFCYAGPLHQDATAVLAAKRILPVYSVERDDRVISISFDASDANNCAQYGEVIPRVVGVVPP